MYPGDNNQPVAPQPAPAPPVFTPPVQSPPPAGPVSPVKPPRKKTKLIVIISVVLVILAGAGIGTFLYMNSKFTSYEGTYFSYRYPVEWKEQSGELTSDQRTGTPIETGYVSSPEYPADSSFLTQEEKSKGAVFGVTMSELSDVLLADFNNPELPESSKKTKIDGRDGVIQDTETREGIVEHYAYAIDKEANRQYRITLSYPSKDDSKYHDRFSEILATLKLK